jgi:hypothetical protein
MFRLRNSQLANAPVRRGRAVAPWRLWTALITTIAFVMLLATAATHHHATAIDDQDCAVCGVVTHKVSDPPLITLPQQVVVVVGYSPYLLTKPTILKATPVQLPPSCGPPVA